MPKGVPREVARLIRSSSRKIAKPGQVLSYENAYKLYDLLDQFHARAARDAARELHRAEHAKSVQGHARALDRLRDLRRDAVGAAEARNALDRAAGVESVPSLAPDDAAPINLGDTPREGTAQPDEGGAEAFVGVDYTQAAGYHHKSGKISSDVSINAVLRWSDGGPITAQEATDALRAFAQTGFLPVGMECESVSWSDWRGRERVGSEADLASFQDVLQHVGAAGIRVGILKEDSR